MNTSTSTVQQSINAAAKELLDAYTNLKVAEKGLKELKKNLKEKLESSPDYLKLLEREKELKRVRKDITEELQDIKKGKEQMALDTDEQKEIDDFIETHETQFGKTQDRVVTQLSRDLADQGIVAEIVYKKGQLMLVVARA